MGDFILKAVCTSVALMALLGIAIGNNVVGCVLTSMFFGGAALLLEMRERKNNE